MLVSATPSPPGKNESAPARLPSEKTTIVSASERSRRRPRTQTYAARHSQNHEAAETAVIPTSSRVSSNARAAPGASPSRANRSSRGLRTTSTIAATPASGSTSSGQRLVPAPPAAASTTTPVASVTRSASTIGAVRRTGTSNERFSSPHLSTSPSLAGVIVIVRPATKIAKLRPRGTSISRRAR